MVRRAVGTGEGRTLTDREGVVVLARSDSARLPGKVLELIGERCLIELVVERVQHAVDADRVIVATSDRAVDDELAATVARRGWSVHRGPVDDVLGRLHAAAAACDLDPVVRVSGDSPFVDPATVRRVLERHARGDVDLATNVFPRTYPAGTSVEVLSGALVDRLATCATEPRDREHVTAWCYDHPESVAIANVALEPPVRDVHLAVDEPLDLARARWIASELGARVVTAPLGEVIALARRFDS